MEKILIVEDEAIVALELKSRLTDLGYSVCGTVTSGSEAIKTAEEQNPSIILMDINIKGPIDGVETAEKIKNIYDIPIIFLTAFSDSGTLERAKITEPYGYIVKPFEERELHTAIEIAIYKHNMEKKLRDSERKLSITLKSIGDAVIATDNKGKINYLNPAAEFLTSCKFSEVLDKYVLDIFCIEDKITYTEADNSIRELLTNGTTKYFPPTITLSCKENKHRIMEANASAMIDNNSCITGIVLVFRDITEKFITEAALLESEKKYREVIENASDVIFGLNINWGFIYANPAAIKITGYSKEELSKLNFFNLLLPEYKTQCKFKLIKQYLSKEKTSFIEYPFKSKSGKIIWFAQNNNLMIEEDKIIGFDIIARDITEKKIAEKTLSDRNRFIETVLQNIKVGLSVHKIGSGKIIYTNSEFKDIFGYSNSELNSTGELFDLEIPDPKIRKEIKYKILRNLLSSKTMSGRWDNINIYPPQSGKKVISISTTSLLDQNIVIATTQDITFKKAADEKILRLSYAVDQSPAAVLITNSSGKIVYANPKCQEISGYAYDEMIGMRPCAFHTPEHQPDENHDITKAVKLGKEIKGEFISYKKDGSSYWEYVIVSPMKDNKNKITNFIIIKQDVSDQKRFQNELIAAKEKAEEMNRLKSVFLANMSHELRTPMVGILGYAQILRDELTEPDKVEMSDRLIKSGNRLLTTLESILEFSQLESKQVNMNLTHINITQKINELVDYFSGYISEKKLKLNVNINNNDLCVLADEKLFSRGLKNIIDNAVKFTFKGEISIETDKVVENNITWGIIKISDTGIGISEEKQKIIFEDFRQASEGKDRSFEGNGLGLTISNKIIKMLNGYIKVESLPGEGSLFTVYLPVVGENKTKIIKPPIVTVKRETRITKDHLPVILLVEDNEMNKQVIEIYLKNICSVDYAKDGETAIQLASQKKYNFVLLDINLGKGMSGVDVMKRLKKDFGYDDVPFIAITGYAMFGDKEILLEEGCSYYLSKPFMKKDLTNLVEEILNTGKKISEFN